MTIFLAGATGALGQRLVPLLISAGHRVVAMTHAPAKVNSLRAAGAEPVVADAIDRDAVMRAVRSARPDVVVHQMTALTGVQNLRNFDREFAQTNKLRVEGTANLLSAACAAGARRFIAQSYAGWPSGGSGTGLKTEDDPLDPHLPKTMQKSLQAIAQLERMVSRAESITGLVLRYGSFYGPGTSLTHGAAIVEMVRQRKLPVIGDGAGVWSFLHIDDAARATLLAIERGTPGLYNIVDNDPAPVSTWVPVLAQTLGAKPPYHIPAWLGRILVGDALVFMMTKPRGLSNAKAKQILGWQPSYASWRDGFQRGLTAKLREAQRVAVVE